MVYQVCVNVYHNIKTYQLWNRGYRRNSNFQTVCDTPIARTTGCVSSLRIRVGDSPSNCIVACTFMSWKLNYSPAVRSNILSKLIFASCVWYSDRAHYGLYVLIKYTARRLPLQLQCVAIRVNRVMIIRVCAEAMKPVFEGDKIWRSCVRKCIRSSSESCKSNNRWGEGGGLKDVRS